MIPLDNFDPAPALPAPFGPEYLHQPELDPTIRVIGGNLTVTFPSARPGGLTHNVIIPLTPSGLLTLKQILTFRDRNKPATIGTPGSPTQLMVNQLLRDNGYAGRDPRPPVVKPAQPRPAGKYFDPHARTRQARPGSRAPAAPKIELDISDLF